jgi:FtsH-binding integral membrane protein
MLPYRKGEFEMAEWSDPRLNQAGVTIDGKPVGSLAVDQGLRSHMLKVYNYMASGVLLTGIVALLFANSGLAAQLLSTPLRWVLMFAPIGFVMVMSFGYNRLSQGALQALFWAFATVMGLSFSSIFLVFSGESIARTFFVTAAAFMALSLYGYTTKKDLTGMGSFLIMGVVGLFLATIVNLFLASSTLHWVISFLGVLIFAGLTAYDTQRIKSEYFHFAGHESLGKIAIMGALNLYLDFVNMFQFLLSFMGSDD